MLIELLITNVIGLWNGTYVMGLIKELNVRVRVCSRQSCSFETSIRFNYNRYVGAGSVVEINPKIL